MQLHYPNDPNINSVEIIFVSPSCREARVKIDSGGDRVWFYDIILLDLSDNKVGGRFIFQRAVGVDGEYDIGDDVEVVNQFKATSNSEKQVAWSMWLLARAISKYSGINNVRIAFGLIEACANRDYPATFRNRSPDGVFPQPKLKRTKFTKVGE